MKQYKIIIIISMVFLFIFMAFPKSTPKKFMLTKKEINSYSLQAKTGNIDAIEKLFKYYVFSENDINKSVYYAIQGAELNNSLMSNYIKTVIEKEPERLIFAVKQGNKLAENIIREHNISILDYK